MYLDDNVVFWIFDNITDTLDIDIWLKIYLSQNCQMLQTVEVCFGERISTSFITNSQYSQTQTSFTI